MLFSDFLKATVLISAAAATALAVVTIAGIAASDDTTPLYVALGWWLVAGAYGVFAGRKRQVTQAIGRLLADARSEPTLPEIRPGRILLNRLWPMLVPTIAAGALAWLVPQVPAIAAGFAIIWALSWRRQDVAVTAIEERDGARFYVKRTAPWRPIELMRTPGLRSDRLGPP